MRVKVCGMREGGNIEAVERLRPDMMGFVCCPSSPRHVAVRPSYLPRVERVGVFVDPSLDDVLGYVRMLGLNRIQLHGSEPPAFCDAVGQAAGLPVMKAIAIGGAEDLRQAEAYEGSRAVDMLLFDTRCPSHGGSGEGFDWTVLAAYEGNLPFLLAGGIGPDDIERALAFRHERLAGFDVNSRFELRPGVKDIDRLRPFLTALHDEQDK